MNQDVGSSVYFWYFLKIDIRQNTILNFFLFVIFNPTRFLSVTILFFLELLKLRTSDSLLSPLYRLGLRKVSILLLRILARCEMNKLLCACVTCSQSLLLFSLLLCPPPLLLGSPPRKTEKDRKRELERESLPHPLCMCVRLCG